MKRFAIAGAGFSGAVLARELVETLGVDCVVFDPRPHVAGNCHTSRDEETGVMVHRYGPHIFHTSDRKVWDYVNRFAEFGPFINRVKSKSSRGIFSLPINLHTINQFFGKQLGPKEAKEFLASLGDRTVGEPQNFEEQALKFVGRELYEAFFYGYTKKQWGCEPRELPAAILKRLPVRFNYDDNYYADSYQGIPRDGYTAIVEGILDHPKIEVRLNEAVDRSVLGEFEHLFFTGPLDGFYGYRHGRLNYRTVTWERYSGEGDYQGVACMNYPDPSVSWTREVEHGHFAPWESHERTVWFREFSQATGAGDVPYYPVRLTPDKVLLAQYVEEAKAEERVSFLGRLATYRYLDMHVIIAETMAFAAHFAEAWRAGGRRPVFSGNPLGG
jgi:UDP-galactopyranose mutase